MIDQGIASPLTAASETNSQGVSAQATNVRKTYGTGGAEVNALDGVSLDVETGRFTAIMGPSGSGKSTLLHCLAGLDSVTSGTVSIGGTDLASLNDAELTRLRRTELGFIFQAFNLLPTLTAEENITLPIRLGGGEVDPDWLKSIVGAVGLGDRLSHRPSELSGGQQQRVAVARALTSKPKIVFADEPTGNLDSNSGTQVLQFMREAVTNLGQTTVMVTHDPYAASYADRAVFLADGRVVADLDSPDVDGVISQMRELGDAQ